MIQKLRAGLRTVVAVPTFFLFTLGVAAVVLLLSVVRRDSPAVERIIRSWSRRFLRIAPMDFEVEFRQSLDPGRQYVFVANHLSNFDIPVLFLSIPHSIRYLAKKELYRIPFVGQAMRAIGMVKIDRQHSRDSHASINEGVTAARARGYSLIVFPEGTRSRDNTIKEFKKGAFRIAIDNGLSIVPVTIHGTWEVWRPDRRVFFPGHATVVVHDPIPTDGMTVADVNALRDRAHDTIEETFTKLKAAADG